MSAVAASLRTDELSDRFKANDTTERCRCDRALDWIRRVVNPGQYTKPGLARLLPNLPNIPISLANRSREQPNDNSSKQSHHYKRYG